MLNLNAPREWLRGGVMVAFAFIVGAAAAARADDLQDAQQLFKSGHAQQALERVNRALAANPREPQARFLKGLIFTEQGKQQEALDIFAKLTQDYPNLPEPYNNLAVIYAGQGQYDKARAALVREPTPKPVAAAPVAKEPPAQVAAVAPKAPEKPAADATTEVMQAVNGWAQAWSKQDVDGYLGYYAKDFQTPGGEARDAWEKTRRTRISGAKSIEVGIDSPKVTMHSPEQASVSFRQTYRSDKLNTKSRKTLELVKLDGRWLIREEKAGK